MTNEDAARILEYPVLKWSTEWDDRKDGLSYCEAIEKAIQALRNRPTGKPLTRGQLREMDGHPVWIQNLERPERSQWRLCHWDRGKYLVLQGISVQGYLLEDYGQTWLAYAYPTHIGREARKPCELCSLPDGTPAKHLILAETCNGKASFCPKCGRPLTEEAWAMLEKRMKYPF